MKKILTLALAGTLMFSIVGCSDGSSKKDSSSKKHSKKDSVEDIIDGDDKEQDDDKDILAGIEDDDDNGGITSIIEGSSDIIIPSKTQIHLNSSMPQDGLAFIIKHDYNYTNNVFIGIKGAGIASDLTVGTTFYSNDSLMLSAAEDDSVSFHLNSVYYNFEVESLNYATQDGKTVELIDNQFVEYKDDNYYVTTTNIDKFQLLYKFDENPWDDTDAGEAVANWDVLKMGYYDSIDEAIAKLNEYKETLYIATFTDDETVEVVNYQDYTCVNDLIMKIMNDNALFVDSYDMITFDGGEITVTKDDYKFEIEIDDGSYSLSDNTSFMLNGIEAFVDGNYVKYTVGDRKVKIYVSMPYDVEKVDSNVIKAILDVFS